MNDTGTEERDRGHGGEPRRPDWVIPAIVLAIAASILLVVVLSIAIASSDAQPATPAQQLEAWTRCLRDEGADIPLVEALDDGGIRVTFGGALLSGDVDPGEWISAFAACGDDAPDGLDHLLDRFRSPLGGRFGGGSGTGA